MSETRKQILEAKIRDTQIKLANIEANLEPYLKLKKQQKRLQARMARLSKELESL